MIPIDMTEQLAPLLIGTELVLLAAAVAVLVKAWRSRVRYQIATHLERESGWNMAIAGLSPSASAAADPAPSDTSVPEAA